MPKNPELRKKHETSPYYQSLNGTWKFEWVKSPHERNMEFYKDSYDTSSWQNIKVPANWQTENYDSPKYTDTRLPWEGVEDPRANYGLPADSPRGIAPTIYNPVGSYKRTFKTPADWDGKEVLYLSKESNPHSMYGSMEKMLDTAKTAIHQQNLISVNI